MTVMTRAEARREKHYDQVADLIPDPIARAEALMEDLAIPAEYEDHGFDSVHEVADYIEQDVVEQIRDAPVPHDAQHFVEDEVCCARDRVYDHVMEEFENHADQTGLEL